MSPNVIFSLMILSQFWCTNFANSCRDFADTKNSIVSAFPGDTVNLRCYSLHNCIRWLWKLHKDAGTTKVIPRQCQNCRGSFEVVQNKTEEINTLVVYNVSDRMTGQYTCSCEWKIQNSSLLTRSTEGCYHLITYNNITTTNPLEYILKTQNISLQNATTNNRITNNLTFQSFTARNFAGSNLTYKLTAHHFTSHNVTLYNRTTGLYNFTSYNATANNNSTNELTADILDCQLEIEVNKRINVYNTTHLSSNLHYLIGTNVGDEVKVKCHSNAKLETNCTNAEGVSLFIVTVYQDYCRLVCIVENTSSKQACYVAAAIHVNQQYLSSTYDVETSSSYKTQPLKEGYRLSVGAVNIPITFLILFAGLFGFFLLLVVALVTYVVKMNRNMKAQSHLMLSEDQPSYNDIAIPLNETTLQRAPSINYYNDNVGIQGYMEMKPTSRHSEVRSVDKEQHVYSDIPHLLKQADVQNNSFNSSNEGTISMNQCFGNVDLYGYPELTSEKIVGNKTSGLDLAYQSSRMRNSMDPRLYSNAMYLARDVKGLCKVHPYSYVE